jgi:nucleoside-diphosphate-sugar epimerase
VVVPAVSGTATLLNFALRHAGPQLASIVVTSSAITITQVTTPPPSANYTYTESDFEDGLIEATKTMTPDSPLYPMRGLIAYGASKTAAEQAVWTFRNTQHPPFAFTTVHPSLVFGAPVLQPTHPSQISASLAFIHDIWAGPSTKGLPDQISTGSWVHVRDVATVHLWAAENPDRADGQRFLATSGFAAPQAVADFLRETFPGRKSVVKGSPGEGYKEGIDWNGRSTKYWYPDTAERISGERSAREIGLVYRSLEETLEESVGAFELLDRE